MLLILVFAKRPRSGPSQSFMTLSIVPPVPTQTHVSLYFKDLQQQIVVITIHPFRNAHATLTCAAFLQFTPSSFLVPQVCTVAHHYVVSSRHHAASLPLLSCCTRLSRCNICKNHSHLFPFILKPIPNSIRRTSSTAPSLAGVYYEYITLVRCQNFVPHNLPLQTFTYSPCYCGSGGNEP